MRRPASAFLVILVVLLYCGTAGAYTASVVNGPEDHVSASDYFSVDVHLDSEGATNYWQDFYITWDPTVLWPDVLSSVVNVPQPGMSYHYYLWSYFSYLTPGMGAMFLSQGTFSSPPPTTDHILATLVFHAMDVPTTTTTEIVASFDDVVPTDWYEPGWIDGSGQPVPIGSITLNPAIIQVPEPASLLVLASGVGLLVFLGRLRRRRAAYGAPRP